MCMKYEKEYKKCFDYMFFNVYPEESIVNFLRDEWNINIVQRDVVGVELFKLLEDWHERGVICPEQEPKGLE